MPKKKTQEQFEADVLKHLGNKYQVLGKYPGSHGKVLIKHLNCNNTFYKNVHDIITKNSGCPYCNGNRQKLYNENWVKENTPLPYHYISDYTKMSEKCKFYCDNCNIFFFQSPSRLINEHIYGCNCYKNIKFTNEDFLNLLGQDCLLEYEVLENYTNNNTKIKFKHKKCGCIFKLSPYAFINKYKKHYCPICFYKKSKGEIIINNFLLNHKIEYQKEFIFPDFPNYRFDFYLPEYRIIIEYDGIQHFEPVDFFGGEKQFNKQIKNDLEKNKYCIENNICLYRIPYKDIENINNILNCLLFEEKSSTTIEKYLITK